MDRFSSDTGCAVNTHQRMRMKPSETDFIRQTEPFDDTILLHDKAATKALRNAGFSTRLETVAKKAGG